MLLKRIFKHSGDGSKLDHVKVSREVDVGGIQKYSTKMWDRLLDMKLLTVSGDAVTLNTVPALRFRIVGRPGYYCCFDNKPMADGAASRAHIEKLFKGKKSPDPNNPAGYRRDNFYACERVA